MKAAALIIGLILTSAVIGFGQTRTVTNVELEKYQQKRLAAERDYRANYERLGMPSPEDLDRQRDADMKSRMELAEQLRQARLEKERLELEQRSIESAQLEAESAAIEVNEFYGGYAGGYGFYDLGRNRFHRGRYPFSGRFGHNRRLPVFYRRGGYRVTPFGVIQTPSPRPVFRRGTNRAWRR